MVAVKKNQPATIQNTNKSVRRSEVVERSRSAVLNPTRRFLARGGCLDTFVISKASTQKEDQAVVAQACFFIQCRFAYGAWPSTGRGVARESRIRENKNRENLHAFPHENLHQRKFPGIRYYEKC